MCIKIDHLGSHKQLWVLFNTTGNLRNFHIHQMKFRLATTEEINSFRIKLRDENPCSPLIPAGIQSPSYQLCEDAADDAIGQKTLKWHDAIPVPANEAVFIVMGFDAQQQVGRFVFHCHILDHEDHGLMAPIEVWDPTAQPVLE